MTQEWRVLEVLFRLTQQLLPETRFSDNDRPACRATSLNAGMLVAFCEKLGYKNSQQISHEYKILIVVLLMSLREILNLFHDLMLCTYAGCLTGTSCLTVGHCLHIIIYFCHL